MSGCSDPKGINELLLVRMTDHGSVAHFPVSWKVLLNGWVDECRGGSTGKKNTELKELRKCFVQLDA